MCIGLPDEWILMLYILHERSLGDKSKWNWFFAAVDIKSLYVTNTPCWDDDEQRAMLQADAETSDPTVQQTSQQMEEWKGMSLYHHIICQTQRSK
jgi:hypothetical protein